MGHIDIRHRDSDCPTVTPYSVLAEAAELSALVMAYALVAHSLQASMLQSPNHESARRAAGVLVLCGRLTIYRTAETAG